MTKSKQENLIQTVIINGFAIAMGFVVYRLISNIMLGNSEVEDYAGVGGQAMGGTCKSNNEALCKSTCEDKMGGTYGEDRRCYDNSGMVIDGGIFGDNPMLLPSKNVLSSQIDNQIIGDGMDSLSSRVNTSVSNRIRPTRISRNRSGFKF